MEKEILNQLKLATEGIKDIKYFLFWILVAIEVGIMYRILDKGNNNDIIITLILFTVLDISAILFILI